MQLSTAAVERLSKIPLREIAETKRGFSPAKIDYEIFVEAECVWQCLAECAALFKQSGLKCKSLRYAAQGRVYFRLRDDGNADLARLDELLLATSGLSIVSWGTIIGFNEREKPISGNSRGTVG